MSWDTANPTLMIPAGSRVKVEIRFHNPPFAGPDAQAIRTAIDSSTSLTTDNASESLMTVVSPGLSQWDITGIVKQQISVNALSQQVDEAVSNLWNAFDVYVNNVSVEAFELPHPSTQTAITLAALAVLALLGFYFLWRLKIV